MTCAFCDYHFCWACGGSASSADNHWGGNGCGIGMMESNIKPGDHLTFMRRTGAHTCLRGIKIFMGFCLAAIICIILFPFWLVLFVPGVCATGAYDKAKRERYGILARSFLSIMGFLLGLVLDICFIPLALCGVSCLILGGIATVIAQICRWMTRPSPVRNDRASQENLRRAEQRL